MKICSRTLAYWYKKNGITLSTPMMRPMGALKRKKLRQEQADWAWSMTKYMEKGYDIIWIDETTTNVWDHRGKIWHDRKYEPVTIHRAADRGKSVTVYGGLVMKTGRLHHMFGKSTNKVEFIEFLDTKIKPHFKYHRTTLLVLDNHASHHSKDVMAWIS